MSKANVRLDSDLVVKIVGSYMVLLIFVVLKYWPWISLDVLQEVMLHTGFSKFETENLSPFHKTLE